MPPVLAKPRERLYFALLASLLWVVYGCTSAPPSPPPAADARTDTSMEQDAVNDTARAEDTAPTIDAAIDVTTVTDVTTPTDTPLERVAKTDLEPVVDSPAVPMDSPPLDASLRDTALEDAPADRDETPPDVSLDVSLDAGPRACLPAAQRAATESAWRTLRPGFEASLRAATASFGQPLYDFQYFSAGMLRAAATCDERAWLDELAQVMRLALAQTTIWRGYRVWLSAPDTPAYALTASQFLHEVAYATRVIASLPDAHRTDAMRAFVAEATPVLRDHYVRWITEGDTSFSNLHAYGCDGGRRLNPRSALSASAWVRTRDADAIVALKFGTTWQLGITGGRASARVVTDTPSATRPETVYEFSGTRTVNDGAWHHLALTWSSATATLSLFVDGTLDRSIAATGAFISGSGRVDLGGYDYGSGRCCFLDGDLDDVRVHARALTMTEVATLARCTASDDCGVADEVVAWSFDGDGSDRLGNEPVTLPTGGAFVPGRAGLALHLDGTSQHAITRNWYGTLALPTFWLGKLTGQLQDSASDPPYCHAVTDIDLWILSGMVELLGARARDPASVSLTTGDERAMRAAITHGLALAERALVETALRDRAGASTFGVVFDPGAWNEHPDWSYAAYEGTRYPTASDRATNPDAGWDLSHATRYVWVFASLYELRAVTGSSFPSPRVMQGFAHQFVYRIFEGDLARPRFRNFFDGSNGWYRVGYDGRPGFGYEPWDLSSAALDGYGFWSEHDPSIAPMLDALWAMFNSHDPAVVAFRDAHYYRYWQARDGGLVRQGGLDEGMRRTYATLTFAPTFARRP